MTMQDMPRPRFDPTVNLGHVLSILAFIGMALGGYISMKSDIDTVKVEVSKVKQETAQMTAALGQLTQLLIDAGRQDERIQALIGRVDRLERKPH